MDSWVGTFLKDIKEKVKIPSTINVTSPRTFLSLLSKDNEVEVSPREDSSSFDYFPLSLSPPELQLLIKYVWQTKLNDANHNLSNILGRLLFLEHLASENASSVPHLEFNMSKTGHASIAALLGVRRWPPEVGYSFVCWFQFKGFKSQQTEHHGTMKLRLFSVSSTESENTLGEELYLREDGVLTIAINNFSLMSFKLELEEGEWYQLAIVQSKQDAAGPDQLSNTLHIYLNGKLRDSKELAQTPICVNRELQAIIGTPADDARMNDLQLGLRSCYLFEEPLSADLIKFMYMLVRGYKDLLQGVDNHHFNFDEDGEAERFVIMDSSSDSGIGRLDDAELGGTKAGGSEINWNLERIENLWVQLCGKKLLCAFNAARTEAMPASQTLALPNLVDPTSAVALTSGMPYFGYLFGDVSICRRCIIGNIISPVTEIATTLVLIETSETRNALHMALTLLASTLHRHPERNLQIKACSGYQLLSLFLKRKVSLFDSQCLHTLFKIALAENPFIEAIPEAGALEVSPGEFHDNLHSSESHEKQDSSPKGKTSNQILGALSDADIVENVLLDWTLWVTCPLSVQLELLNTFENLISVYRYKDQNISVLSERNIVQHLLAALRRDDIEMLVLEKMVILLGVILEHKFLDLELESVTMFVLSTFDPPEVVRPLQVTREMKSKRVTLRNMLLEALIDLQVTIFSEDLLEKWHTIVSSKIITYFLDDAIHPTSMIWIITFLCLCLTSSRVFAANFESSGGYQTLARVLPSFHDFLDIYYTLFCAIFGKPIYPKLPEVGIMDFEALILNNEDINDLKFVRLLDSVVAMVKSVFNQLRVQPNLSQQALNISQASVDYRANENTDCIEELSGEKGSMHKTPTLLGLEASITNATSVLRFMSNLAKMSPSFSNICKRPEFLESCVDLYFSIVRAYMAVKLTKELNVPTSTNFSIVSDGDELTPTKSGSPMSYTEDSGFSTTSHLLLEIDNYGYSGEPSSVGATAMLDLIAEVLSVTIIAHIDPVPIVENLLVSVPLNLDFESVLTFRALCLSRVMNYLERRLDFSDVNKDLILDKNSLWSNLGSFCNLIVDQVYLGVFPRLSEVIRVLEFCLSMLHSAKKDGQIEELSLPWTGILSILRGGRPVEVIQKSINRMIQYCFLPPFPASIKKDPLISQDELRVDVCIILELIHAHKEIIFHPTNVDSDFYCCLCINLIPLFFNAQSDARNSAIGILKYLLVHCRASLEEVLISKSDPKKPLDIVTGGLDKLLTETSSTFMMWLHNSEHDIKLVLQKSAGIKWSQFVAESIKLRKERLVSLEDHWTTKMGRKVEQASKTDLMYWDQYIDRRSTLTALQNAASVESELANQKKRDLIIHAENEWRSHFEQLRHEHKVEPISSLVWEDYWPL